MTTSCDICFDPKWLSECDKFLFCVDLCGKFENRIFRSTVSVEKMPVDINRLTEGWLELESDPGALITYNFSIVRQ